MSLFVINRYVGETEEQPKDENKNLSELLKRIEERKRERLVQSGNVVLDEGVQSVKEQGRKKKKKKKDKPDPICVTEDSSPTEVVDEDKTVACESISEDLQKVRKKKKRSKKDVQGEDDICAAHEASEHKDVSENLNADQIENNKNLLDSNNKQEKVSERQSNFMILGSKTEKKKSEVRRVLPDWLAHPEIVSFDLSSGPSLEELDSVLDPKLINVLRANGIDKLFPVQASMITWLAKCRNDKKQGWWLRDTCVSAPTGSGKTMAYVLPIVQELQSRLVPKIRCLVVVPVQELAAQVHKVMVTYTAHTNLKVGLISGACSFEQEQNKMRKKTLRGGYISTVDIVVATPGRLVDHLLRTPEFSLTDLRFLVIDEADRSAEWLQYLPEPHCRPPRLTIKNLRDSKPPAQKLLFSATLSQDPEKLSRLGLFQPILFTSVVVSRKDDDVNLDNEVGDFIGRYTSPEELTELAVECPAEYKPVALYQLITRDNEISKTLVFTNSGEAAHRLSLLLQLFLSEKNVTVGELSAQLAPKQRETILEKFSTGDVHVLVSSDALARGVDIPNVRLVISYDLPKYIKGYIHRAGRTGRAGKTGTAISVLISSQVGIFKHMLSNAHKTVPTIEKLELESAAAEINYQSHVEKLKEVLEKEKQDNLQRKKAVKRKRPKDSG